MQVVFYLADARNKEHEYLALAKLMVASVRETMPHAEIVQMSDRHTPAVLGIDRVDREPLKGPLIYERVRRMAHYRGDVLALDPDVIVRKSVANVFKKDFDVALTVRDRRIEVEGVDVTQAQPFNGGVMFCRNPEFWREVLREMDNMEERERYWFGAQTALANAARSGKFHIVALPGSVYNYSPDTWDEDLTGRKVIHYKGRRKHWMLETAREHEWMTPS